jgi:hypothetical protein
MLMILHSMRHPFAARWAASTRKLPGRSPRRARALATCIAIAVFSAATSVICLWQAKADLDLRTLSNESLAWPAASGEIVDASLDRSAGRGPSVGASIRYRFIVGEKTFEGQTMAFDEPRGAAAENAVHRYRPGTKVRVFYRPRAPSTSVLERASWTGWRRVVALVFAALGTALLAAALVRVSRRIADDPRPA